MADDDDFLKKALWLGLAILAIFAIALLIAIIKSPQVLTGWVLLTVRITISLDAALLGAGSGVWLFRQSLTSLTNRVAELEASHEKILKQLRNRTPTAIATTALVSQAILLIADKSFEGDTIYTVVVSILLVVVFWVANELQTRTKLWVRIVGWVLWFTVVLFYFPATVLLFHRTPLSDVLGYVSQLPFRTKLVSGLITVLLLVAPAAVSHGVEDE